MFTAFIKILPVGELPIHKPEITLSTNNATGEIKTIPQWRYGNCNGVFTCITENPQSRNIPDNNSADWFSRNIFFNETHSHTVTANNIGNNEQHNNIPPYISVYMWKRIA